MRITKIRLAGFKSFVDPANLNVSSQLVGIVGPNGCGKSNLVDALNWVLGESSARHLRGESMTDVIFNGSSSRQPVGQASVELILDNSDGKIGGQFANFNEISVKRALGRDGVSNYSLNGTRCRRKDIAGLFLGTGVGARSYAVIEQGMISRIVDAKPDELRKFLEEAAGISKYKERRRETESRIRGTVENLERIDDIREELGKRLQHLERQARAAERYRDLKAEERQVQAQLLGFRWCATNGEMQQQARQLGELEAAADTAAGRQREVEAQLAAQQEQLSEDYAAQQAAQQRLYEASAAVTAAEQRQEFLRQREDQLRVAIAESEVEATKTIEQIDADQRDKDAKRGKLAGLANARSQREAEAQASREQLDRLLGVQEQARVAGDQVQQTLLAHRRDMQQALATLHSLQREVSTVTDRRGQLLGEQQQLKASTNRAQIDRLERTAANSLAHRDRLVEESERRTARAKEIREAIEETHGQLEQVRAELATSTAEAAALAAALAEQVDEDGENVAQWLEPLGLARQPRLLERLQVDPGWEVALELVLEQPLGSRCVDDITALAGRADELPAGRYGFIAESGQPTATEFVQSPSRLANKVNSAVPLPQDLSRVLCAESNAEALALLADLQPGQSVVTRDGIWMSQSWVRVRKTIAPEKAALVRQKQLEHLEKQNHGLEASSRQLLAVLQSRRDELQVLEDDSEARALLRAATERAEQESLQVATERVRLENAERRNQELDREIAALETRIAELVEERRGATEKRLTSQVRAASAARDEVAARARDASIRQQVAVARDQHDRNMDRLREVVVAGERVQAELTSLETTQSRNEQVLASARQRGEDARAELAGQHVPLEEIRHALETGLAARQDAEVSLTAVRERLQHIEAAMRELDAERQGALASVRERGEAVTNAQVELRALEVRRGSLEEQLQQLEVEVESVTNELADDLTEATLTDSLGRIQRAIARLGPINLAALDEVEQVSERKAYLDAQHLDLTEALTTLENAIRRIDGETRMRFKETFDAVNEQIKEKFPTLFGGGHAYLEMTEDDLLETGVVLMARPPGKRNTSIQLLSGGEKALTALSLVFAIFALNPAPFCLLDEVDAPLDDANVDRYARLVKEMSESVQFIFVTHNKITMEIADQLVGVTMGEAGVSRFVAVNMDEAVALAATA